MSLLLAAHALLACPLCDTGTGERVRAGILGPGLGFFVQTLAATLAPFVVISIVILGVYFERPSRRRTGSKGRST